MRSHIPWSEIVFRGKFLVNTVGYVVLPVKRYAIVASNMISSFSPLLGRYHGIFRGRCVGGSPHLQPHLKWVTLTSSCLCFNGCLITAKVGTHRDTLTSSGILLKRLSHLPWAPCICWQELTFSDDPQGPVDTDHATVVSGSASAQGMAMVGTNRKMAGNASVYTVHIGHEHSHVSAFLFGQTLSLNIY